jgi:hypothetical protein
MDSIISKYNALSEDKRSRRKLWQKVRFGNGEMQDLAEIRLKLSAHTSAILLSLNLCSLGSRGRIERRLNNVGGDLDRIRWKVDWIAANMAASSGEGTVWSSYTDDDRGFWRELRRGLVKEGYRSSVIHRHKHLIKQYVEELGNRGVFDEGNDASLHGEGVDEEKENLASGSSDSEDADEEETAEHAVNTEEQQHSPRDEHEDKLSQQSDEESAPTALDSQCNVDPDLVISDDTSEPQITLLDARRVIDALMTPPESPKTSKYLRFDKRIHVGSINPRAMKARTPEEQAAHDKRKEERRRRTPEQREAHEKRKGERNSGTTKHRRVVVHAEHRLSSEERTSPNPEPGQHIQMEEILDEEFSPITCQNDQEEYRNGRGAEVYISKPHNFLLNAQETARHSNIILSHN